MNRGHKQTDLIIMDFAKAFDKVPHRRLFSPMGDITVDPKGVAKLLDGLNVHKAPGPDGLNARVLKECSNEISPILTLIFNESLAWGDVPDEWRQANVSPIFKKGEKYDAATDRCCSQASAAKR